MECNDCRTINRPVAKYCKNCGKEVSQANANENPQQELYTDFETLLGMEDLKQSVSHKVKAIKNMKKVGFNYNLGELSMILTGNTGTGKSKVVELLSKLYYKHGITTNPDAKI